MLFAAFFDQNWTNTSATSELENRLENRSQLCKIHAFFVQIGFIYYLNISYIVITNSFIVSSFFKKCFNRICRIQWRLATSQIVHSPNEKYRLSRPKRARIIFDMINLCEFDENRASFSRFNKNIGDFVKATISKASAEKNRYNFEWSDSRWIFKYFYFNSVFIIQIVNVFIRLSSSYEKISSLESVNVFSSVSTTWFSERFHIMNFLSLNFVNKISFFRLWKVLTPIYSFLKSFKQFIIILGAPWSKKQHRIILAYSTIHSWILILFLFILISSVMATLCCGSTSQKMIKNPKMGAAIHCCRRNLFRLFHSLLLCQYSNDSTRNVSIYTLMSIFIYSSVESWGIHTNSVTWQLLTTWMICTALPSQSVTSTSRLNHHKRYYKMTWFA